MPRRFWFVTFRPINGLKYPFVSNSDPRFTAMLKGMRRRDTGSKAIGNWDRNGFNKIHPRLSAQL